MHLNNQVFLMPVIESASGIENSYEIGWTQSSGCDFNPGCEIIFNFATGSFGIERN